MTFERRIGGEMELTAPMLCAPRASGGWPTFAKSYVLRCDTGRSALRIALLDRLRRCSSAVVWLPSYICPSVSSCVASLGVATQTYTDQPGLTSWSAPPTPADGDVVIVIHYFGAINRAAWRWLDALPERRWALIEDCVQAAYSAGAGGRGEYAIASLRKWWPAPDGSVLCTNQPLFQVQLSPPSEEYVNKRVAAKLVRGNDGCDESTYLRWIDEGEQLLSHLEPRQVSWISSQLIGAIDPQSALEARRSNWAQLSRGLAGQDGITPLFSELRNGEIPLGFPIRVCGGRRDRLRAFLMERRVYCPVHWQLPAGVAAADRELSEQILTIPIDQRYGATDMQRVLADIREFVARNEH